MISQKESLQGKRNNYSENEKSLKNLVLQFTECN